MQKNIKCFFIAEPKHRQAWLKVWFDKLEQAELENYEVFEVTEENDEELINDVQLINDNLVFRLPTACDIAEACTGCSRSKCQKVNDRKISSSSDFSTCSYASNTSEG